MTSLTLENATDVPNLCDSPFPPAGAVVPTATNLPQSDLRLTAARAMFAIALHMHQPLIPAGGPSGDSVISNLRFMFEHPEIPDAHNASAFLWCYKRMGEFIPQLVAEGKSPRVMLDYSGCLLHGLQQMGAHDVIEALQPLARDPRYVPCVEWLGTAWGHAVAPSTPPGDFRLHVLAWKHHFASIFGDEAAARVRGFSPPEMALPNDPDVCSAFVRSLKEAGYRWVIVQEDTVEQVEDGGRCRLPHLPHRLIARNSAGESVSIIAIIKTHGSDNKLVGQMQPFYEAKGVPKVELGGNPVPQLAVQIGDGENGGVMMNEFPPKFMQVLRDEASSDVPAVNVSEYLSHLASLGVTDEDFPEIQPVFQGRIWSKLQGRTGSDAVRAAIEEIRKEDPRFHMEGGSWTNDRSWVRGYEGVLGPMQEVSAKFNEEAGQGKMADETYRKALYYLLLTQTSCFRYWGEGQWTNWGRDLCKMALETMTGEE